MKKGFVLGKFMPLHKGHLALIDFAFHRCDQLSIILCHTDKEPIQGAAREQWLHQEMKKYPGVIIISFFYYEKQLPNTSVSSREVSGIWAKALKEIVPDAAVFFSSEPYGDFIAEFMDIQHQSFDKGRTHYTVSATQIRSHPLQYWDHIADAAKSYFVKKVALVGSESTGKSTLAEKLAAHYHTSFVPEMARAIIQKTEECVFDDLKKIAELHASSICKKIMGANKLLFADTDITITKSYSLFLFKRELLVDDWIEEANRFDLYLFLEPDCEYVQDGTRLSEPERMQLSEHHKAVFQRAGIPFISVKGNWEERYQAALAIIDSRLLA